MAPFRTATWTWFWPFPKKEPTSAIHCDYLLRRAVFDPGGSVNAMAE
jgi:hypothetical protein